MKEKIGAAYFVECSAKTGENLVGVFEAAVRAALGDSDGKCLCLFL